MSAPDEPEEPFAAELPFTTADAGDGSRIAGQIRKPGTLLRNVQRVSLTSKSQPAGTLPPSKLPKGAIVRTGGLKQSAGAFAGKLETRLAAHPAFNIEAERGTASIARLRFVIGTQSVVLLALLGLLVFTLNDKNDTGIYASASTTGAAHVMAPLLAPTYTQAAVLAWAGTRAASIMNFGFNNVGDRLATSRENFTDRGWNAFAAAVDRSQLMQNVVANEQVVTAAPIGAPVIVHMENTLEGGRSWTIQLPIMVTIISGKAVAANRRVLTLEIVTVPPTHNLTGLGINNWVESG